MSYDNYNKSFRRNKLTCRSFLEASHLFTPTSDQRYALGTELELDDATGRKYRYCKNGAVVLTAAKVNQSAAGTANWQNQVQTNGSAWSIGDKTVTAVLTSTATKDQFADGYLTIEDGTGEGQMYLIKGNKAGTANATSGYDVEIELADEGGIRIATATTSEVSVTLNKHASTLVAAVNPTGTLVGVNPMAVTAAYFFWAQVKGPAAVVVDDTDTIVVGDKVMTSESVAGTCALVVAAADDHTFGTVMRAAAVGETALIDLNIE